MREPRRELSTATRRASTAGRALAASAARALAATAALAALSATGCGPVYDPEWNGWPLGWVPGRVQLGAGASLAFHDVRLEWIAEGGAARALSKDLDRVPGSFEIGYPASFGIHLFEGPPPSARIPVAPGLELAFARVIAHPSVDSIGSPAAVVGYADHAVVFATGPVDGALAEQIGGPLRPDPAYPAGRPITDLRSLVPIEPAPPCAPPPCAAVRLGESRGQVRLTIAPPGTAVLPVIAGIPGSP
jgi:hypothetical protein